MSTLRRHTPKKLRRLKSGLAMSPIVEIQIVPRVETADDDTLFLLGKLGRLRHIFSLLLHLLSYACC